MYKFGRFGYLAWPCASALCMGLALMFSKLSQSTTKPGPAGFTHQAFGHLASFQVSWVHWLGLTIAQAIICFSFGQYVQDFIPGLTSNQIGLITLIGLTGASCFLTIFSVGAIQIITALKVGALLLIIISGLPYLNLDKISTLPVLGDQTNIGAFVASMSICLLSFTGMEVATLPSGNVHNPRITIPLATIVGTLIPAILYICSYAVVGSGLSVEQIATSTTPMLDAAELFMGPWGKIVLRTMCGIGFFASINGMLYGQSFIARYAGSIRAIPTMFNYTSESGFPIIGAIFSAICSGIILSFVDAQNLGTFAALSACFISLAYLWSVMAYRYLVGSIALWIINFATVCAFLYGSMVDCVELIPVVVILYCTGFLLYGCFVTSDKLECV